ncbi:disulfide bond formation protein B [Deinococcus cavernae]|uniref:Disulfide bond formation protein B n=1 Tax=Deinococcus cavernae TaxID=2320857 RepID=A0A418V649_9DEIO|nr:disulfide bond formation protein B [Deinococcus cavernae]RJF71583.1 disulfide bond formation protein B [Deinococcus cavernae]
MTRDTRLYLAWVVAIVATLGSLFFSEIKEFRPCILCWYQRIAMYPLAVLLGLAAFRSDFGIRRYALTLAAIGWGLALFQNLETWGVVPTIKACTTDPSASCGIPWPIWGATSPLNTIITIPVLSMIAFTLIIALLSWKREPATAVAA